MLSGGPSGIVARVIEMTALTKRYRETTAVDALTCTVRPGRVTGFLGPNGAGKSTTLRMILGLAAPSAGTVTVGGRPFRDHARGLHHVGALLDAADVHGGRSARSHLRALAASNRIGRTRVDEVLAEVGLSSAAGRAIGRFSLGMRQRLGIATALLGDPPVLLFDEPFNGLDPEGVQWVRALFQTLAAQGRTVFVSSHLMSEMENTADHLVIIGRGRLLADESLADFARRDGTSAVLVRTPDAARFAALLPEPPETDGDALVVRGLGADELGDLAFTHGVRLHELTPRHASLEESFMRLTADRVEFSAGGAR